MMTLFNRFKQCVHQPIEAFDRHRLRLIPSLAFTIIASVFAIIWIHLQQRELETLQEKTDMAADQVAIRVQKYLGMRLHMISNMRDSWVDKQLSNPQDFEIAATFLERNLGGIQAINFVDPSGVIRWVVPEAKNPNVKGKNLSQHPNTQAVFNQAAKTGRLQMTSVIELFQGGKGIVGYLPITINGKREGYLNWVVNVEPMMEEVVAGSIRQQFFIEILDHDEVLYSYGEGKRLHHTYISTAHAFHMGPVNWTIRLFPNRKMFKENTTRLDDLMLASGFVLALWLALLLRRLLLREIQLRESEERYRALFRNAQVGLFRIRLGDGKVLQANPVMARMYGYDNAEEFQRDYYMGHNWVDPARKDELRRQLETHGGTADNFEAEFYDRNKKKVWVRFSCRAFVDKGYLEGVGLCINNEKEHRQALEESEKRFRALAESTSAVIFIIDENHRIRYANQAAVKGTGYSLEELGNMDPSTMMPFSDREKMDQAWRQADPSDLYFGPFELQIQCKDGEKAWIAMTVGAFEEEGERAYISTSFNITERKRAEEALKQSEEKFRAFFENAQAGLFRVELESGKVLEANGKMARMFGYEDRDEFMKHYRFNATWFHPEEPERLKEEFDKGNGTVEAFETRFMRRDGRIFWIRFSANLDKEHGTMEGVGIDITEEKETAQHLKDSELRFRALADSTSAAIHITSVTDLIYCNQALEDLSGYNMDELRDLPDSQLIAPESLPDMERLARAIMTGKPLPKEALEFGILRKDGERRWLQSTIGAFHIGGEEQFIWTSFDITDRKQAEQALRHSEELFRTIYENAPVMIAAFRPDGTLFLWNQHLEKIFGYSLENINQANNILALCYPDSQGFMQMMQLIREHDGKFHELHPVNQHGERLTQLWAHFALPDDTVVSVGHDITDRTQAEQALRDSESKYRTIFETTGTGTVIFGDDGMISLANDEFCHLVGMKRSELEGQRAFWDLFQESSRETILTHHQQRNEKPGQTPRAYEVNLLDVHSRLHEGIISIGLIPGTSQRVASFLDLTERKQAERQIIQADKMAALGQIIAGVAHEINNPNNFIYFNLPILRQYIDEIRLIVEEKQEQTPDLLLMGIPVEDFLKDVYQLLEDMEHGSSRITGIVSELKNYVRSHEEEERKAVRVETLVRQVMTLVGKQVRKMVKRLEIDLEEGLPPVLMLSGKLEQVLINLLINAGQAANKEDSQIHLRARLAENQKKPTLEIVVEDNGQGIPADIQSKIFEPFFTTKGRESGTGLGLAISNRIVEEHNGSLLVESTPGEGTRFTILLPAAEDDDATALPTGEYLAEQDNAPSDSQADESGDGDISSKDENPSEENPA